MTSSTKKRIAQLRQGQVPKRYRLTRLGIVPSDWLMFRIGDCLERVERPVEVQADKLYTQIGIRSHGKGLFYKEQVTGAELGNKAVFWIEPNCFILNIVFAWEQAIGKTTQAEEGMIGSHRFPMYRPINNRVDIDYLINYFLTKRGTEILEAASPGGAGRNKTLGQDRFLKSRVILPPLAEQRKIAKILATQDRVIELKKKLLEETKRRKKALVRMLMESTGLKRLEAASPRGAAHCGEAASCRFVGTQWRKVKLGDLFSFGNGYTPSTAAREYWDGGTIPWFRMEDIRANGRILKDSIQHVTPKAVKKTGLFPAGSFILSTTATIGEYALLIADSLANQRFTFLIKNVNRSSEVDTMYFLQYLAVISKWCKKTANAGGLLAVNIDDLSAYEFLLPPLAVQRQIAAILSAADREIDLLRQNLEQEERKKKALMQLLLTGIVRVRGVESGVAKRLPADRNLLANGKQIRKECAKCRRTYQ